MTVTGSVYHIMTHLTLCITNCRSAAYISVSDPVAGYSSLSPTTTPRKARNYSLDCGRSSAQPIPVDLLTLFRIKPVGFNLPITFVLLFQGVVYSLIYTPKANGRRCQRRRHWRCQRRLCKCRLSRRECHSLFIYLISEDSKI